MIILFLCLGTFITWINIQYFKNNFTPIPQPVWHAHFHRTFGQTDNVKFKYYHFPNSVILCFSELAIIFTRRFLYRNNKLDLQLQWNCISNRKLNDTLTIHIQCACGEYFIIGLSTPSVSSNAYFYCLHWFTTAV